MTKVILLILWEPLLIICSVVLLHPRELLHEVTAVMEFQRCSYGALCVEMGFMWTFPRNQDATVKLKSELISIKF